MADGVLSSNTFVMPYRCQEGPVLLSFPLGSTASTAVFKKGDAVARGATTNSHRVVLLATGVTADLTGFIGFAAEDAVSSEAFGTPKLVYVADRSVEFIGAIKSTIAAADLGLGFNLRRDSTLDIWYLDGSDATGTGVVGIVTGFVNGSTFGDTNGFVSFLVANAAMQMYRSSS